MKTKFGKWYARWTGADGKRHEKAFENKRKAEKFQAERQKERIAKKAHPGRKPHSRPSSPRGSAAK